ncbi:MAG: hypothetical protein V8S95_00685 [Odoribacter sp.]
MRIIVPHRRGIMGTVIFHLLLAILLLGMEIRKVEVHAEMEIVMEAPDPEEIRQQEEEQLRKEEIRHKSSAEEVNRLLRSIAVNENVEKRTEQSASVEEYVDEIMQELQRNGEDGRYKARQDKNYKRDSLQMYTTGKNRSWIP